jgi:hypothetical protein
MTDYVPLIARAVAGLEKNTGAARRALYERARTALLAQLRTLDPPLTESEVTRERLSLEEGIRKVEADAARQSRMEPRHQAVESRKPEPAVPAPAPREPRHSWEASVERVPDPLARTPEPSRSAGRELAREAAPLIEEGDADQSSADVLEDFRALVAEIGHPSEIRLGAAPETPRLGNRVRRSRAGAALKREHAEEPERQDEPAEETFVPNSAAVHKPFADLSSKPLDLDHFGPIDPRDWSSTQHVEEPSRADARPEPPRPARRALEDRDEALGPVRGSRRGLLAALLGMLVLAGAAGGLYWKREAVRAWFVKTSVTQPQREAAPSRGKIADRVGQPGQDAPAAQPEAVAPAAQQVVLYEDDPASSEPQGKRYVGSVVWRTETVSASGQPPDIAIKADMEIPERRMSMNMSIRRNTDKALPATHTVEIMFNLPADFPFGGISNVPGILMKQAEQTRGAPLAGLAVKVTSGFFLVGLSSGESDIPRNMELLKDRGWFDIPLVYNNGRRAILAVEKGTPGERAFTEAFAAWGQ